MFIGHFAAAFATKKVSNSLSLALMFIAVQFLDLIWPILVLLGVETVSIEAGITKLTPLDFTSYPYSHSLFMAIVWGLLFGLIYFVFTKKRQNALLLGALVVSHWFLDLIVHRPDLPLSPFSDLKVGFGLWNYPFAEILIEFSLFFISVYLYFVTVKPKRRIIFWSLISFLLIIQLLNFFGPIPTDGSEVAWGANLLWVFVVWAWWIERKDKQSEVNG
jgi:membrane-bound metal-dependent hydrolase YbcI (DUF457 family)